MRWGLFGLLLANSSAGHVGRGCATPHHSISTTVSLTRRCKYQWSHKTLAVPPSPMPRRRRALCFILSNDQKNLHPFTPARPRVSVLLIAVPCHPTNITCSYACRAFFVSSVSRGSISLRASGLPVAKLVPCSKHARV
jgi:hypothetical protein